MGDVVTHDPLCNIWDGGCDCDLIAKVRADQSIRAANRLLQGVLVEGTPIFGCPICPDIWESEPSCEHYEVAERFADMLGQP